MTKESSTTNHDNYHLAINNSINISKLIQLLIKDSIFEKQFSQKYEIKKSDLFTYKKVKMTTRISYISIKYALKRIRIKYLQLMIQELIKILK